MNCSYRYPSRINDHDTEVERTFWFTELSNNEPVDLRTDSKYAGRVQYHCDMNDCTLRITDLRESDSAEYKFMFITNEPGERFTGSPGVTLTVTGLQVQVIRSRQNPSKAELKCLSSCRLPDRSSYIWYKNGQKIWRERSSSYSVYFNSADSFSCAVEGYEDFPSLPVYAPKVPSVSLSPSGEIEEGSSLTLACSSDANPAANYTWFSISNVSKGFCPVNYTGEQNIKVKPMQSDTVRMMISSSKSEINVSSWKKVDCSV
ncbi:uncharacterized protein LOC121881289 [Thunnus maccoyii]|uniref:uncharacterized protein LOC121881289 n=1 Tax=Thunnus maccoyii TaxID=8240 RepID=UPI001C4B7744|nr:uncharacterized protein LOC121881289 [Thunnus maccoyii]